MARLVLLPLALAAAMSAQTSRELSDLNWMDIRDTVPARVQTVLLPTGTLEPHGVINNGADIVAPVAIARQIAGRVNALVAPVVPYGMTGSLDGYAGSFTVSETAYRAYMSDVMAGLARMGFRNIIVINGHGGPQTAVLNEVAEAAQVAIEIDETSTPLRVEVRGFCEILGLDPLYLANEGKIVAIVPPAQAQAALTALQAHPLGRDSRVIGRVAAGEPGRVSMRTVLGGSRIVDMLVGEQLPRIC